MELKKQNIHMNKWKGKYTTQATLDDDFNVSDTLPDMDRIICGTGEIQLENTRVQGEKVTVKGKLVFSVLYSSQGEENSVHNMTNSIPIEETINVPEVEDKDHLQLKWDIEDLTTGMINSRKLSVKAIVTFTLSVESLYDESVAVEVESTQPVQVMNDSLEVAQLAIQKKDTFRVKEEIQLPTNKPNISNIMWNHLDMRNVEAKLLDGSVSLRGELMLFVFYQAEGEHVPIQWTEKSILFSGNLELPDCVEDMIPAIDIRLMQKNVEAKPDYDGENRMIEVDAVLELDMKIYEENRIQMLSDVYSPAVELAPEYGEACFEGLLVKNLCKCRVTDKISMGSDDKILQICHSFGTVKIDDVQIVEDGLQIEGYLNVSLLYMSSDDKEPLKSIQNMIPFQYTAEAKGIDANSTYQLKPGLEQLNTVMLGSDEVEVKAVVTLDLLVLRQIKTPMIREIREYPLDLEKLQDIPGIVGYIVQPGDNLWKISKKFHTTVDDIKATNGLTSDDIKPGDRLLLIKQVEQMWGI